MAFSSLRTASFRNLVDSETDVRGKDIFLVGENGQGKSNFLEALYFCSYGSSFRGSRDKDLVRNGEKDCSASVSLENSLYTQVNAAFKEGKKVITLDGKKVEDRKDLLSVNPSIVFCHEDMEFVAGTPERRRWFFDQTRSLWDPLYLEDLRNYRYVLKSRNALIRRDGPLRPRLDSETAATLDALEPQMAQYGLELQTKRRKTAEEFSLVFEPLYREISGISGIGIQYLPSWKEETIGDIIGRLNERREADLALGVSLSGPHRDRYLFTREGEEFSEKASTGQRRLLALLLRIAQARFFSEKTGKKPVLLLDDVLLELDGEKKLKFLSIMPDYEQAFYTFLPGEPFEKYRKPDTIVYCMNAGQVKGDSFLS
ncbi:MAG: DNA replication and repair protein RecF [Treponema sp.]|nr:DNA replication and repair protein RecF [Treponema sp.]